MPFVHTSIPIRHLSQSMTLPIPQIAFIPFAIIVEVCPAAIILIVFPLPKVQHCPVGHVVYPKPMLLTINYIPTIDAAIRILLSLYIRRS